MLEVSQLDLAHGNEMIVSGLDLAFQPGEVTALVGPNGAGKSTLLRTLFGDLPAYAGAIRLEGEPYQAGSRRRWQSRISYMPQDSGVPVGLTALEAVLVGAVDRLSLRLREATLRDAAALLEQFGILELANRRLETLSGGQRQLVFFAQMMMRSPRLLLLDEPVSALDMRHQILLLKQVRKATVERALVTIVVLHDLNLAARFADRLVMIHQGRMRVDGRPRQVLSSQLLETVYGVRSNLHYDLDGHPWVHVHDAVVLNE